MPTIAEACRKQLTENILPFWLALKDETYGGFYGYVGYDLAVDPKAEKGCILNSRILWFFSEAALLLDDPQAKAAADHAYRFLAEHCVDPENGGVYWSLTYDGKPLDTTKHTYNQAFALYALGAYYRLTGNEEALELALGIFDLIEDHCTDEIGYLEAFTVDWQPESNEKLSENGVMADKTMNTLLHVLEGYAGLYQACHEEKVGQAMRWALDIYANKIYSPELKRNLVFFDTNYNSIIDLYSYGHDIESSWLVDWAADLLQDEALSAKIHEIDKTLADSVYAAAYRDHSLANECDRGKVDEKRVWWVQAEAVLGMVNRWLKDPADVRFRDAAADIYRFIEAHLVDPRSGEWYHDLYTDGTPYELPIVEPWKCPYHNGRMCMEMIRRNPHVNI